MFDVCVLEWGVDDSYLSTLCAMHTRVPVVWGCAIPWKRERERGPVIELC